MRCKRSDKTKHACTYPVPFGLAKNINIIFLIYTLQIQLRNIATPSEKKKIADFVFFLFSGHLCSHPFASPQESFVSDAAISWSTTRCQRKLSPLIISQARGMKLVFFLSGRNLEISRHSGSGPTTAKTTGWSSWVRPSASRSRADGASLDRRHQAHRRPFLDLCALQRACASWCAASGGAALPPHRPGSAEFPGRASASAEPLP